MIDARFTHNGTTYVGDFVGRGMLLWHLDGKSAVAALMPVPDSQWPARIRELYALRVVANVTLVCPLCSSGDLSISQSAPGQGQSSLTHEPNCAIADGGELTIFLGGLAT